MRKFVVVAALSLVLGVTAAQAIDIVNPLPKEAGAGASAQPQLPAAVATPGQSATVGTPEPNLKKPTGNGGKISSYVIKDAPLPTDFVLGKPEAKLVVIEYASLFCPHCAHFSNTVLPELEKRYIETGKIRYILRQFPLNEPAMKGAELLDCVGEQDKAKYYVFAKVLFESQNKWAFDTNFLSNLETIAMVGGLTKDQFQKCTATGSNREIKVLKDKKVATDEVKVPHTPYIIVGDTIYDGEPTLEAVSAFIDGKLAENK